MNTKGTTFWSLSLLLLLATTIFSGCNHVNSVIDDDDIPADSRGSKISFAFDLGDYTAEDNDNATPSSASAKAMSRAMGRNDEANVLSSSTEDLGNGLEALVEVVENPVKKVATRSIHPAPAGKYTVLAYQGGALKAKWILQYNGTTYQPIEGTMKEQYLPKGYYDFYVFNEALSLENGKIVATLDHASKNALFCVEKNKEIRNVRKTAVNFTLKPYCAEVYFKIKGFSTPAFEGPTNGSFVYAANKVPGTTIIDPANGSTTTTNKPTAGDMGRFASFTGNIVDGNNSYIKSNDAKYFLPGTDVKELNFKFDHQTGMIYKKAIAGKTLHISQGIAGNLKGNTSYTISVTVYYTANYLFSDGTTGTMGNKGTRTPIALVVGKHNGKTYAMALKDADSRCQWAKKNSHGNRFTKGNFKDFLDRYDGYDFTYERLTTWSPPNVVKANNPEFPAFNAVANYNPGVSLTGSIANAKWYMPGLSEWELALQTFQATSLRNRSLRKPYDYTGPLKNQLVQILFWQAGGVPLGGFYWSADTSNLSFTIIIHHEQDKTSISVALKNDQNGSARSVIRF